MTPVKVSCAIVRSVLEKYLDDTLAHKIYWDIFDTDAAARRDVIGMTYREWNTLFDDDRYLVWADDTKAGFGKAGWPVYGDADDCIICQTAYDGHRYTLYLWDEILTTDKPWIIAAVNSYKKRHAKEA